MALNSSALKLYGNYVSTCTMRVIETLYEKDISSYEFSSINIAKKEQKQPEFLKKQPFGVIPALEDGDFSLFESRAIARYICNKYEGQGTNLLGSTLEEKAVVDQWLEVEASNYNPAISVIVFEKAIKKRYGLEADEALVAAAIPKLEKVLDIYEQHLSKQPYLAGENFSLADLSHLPYTHRLVKNTNFGDLILSRPHVKAWWEKISSRPAWKRTLAHSE